MLHERPEAADAGLDRRAVLGMGADQPRQRQQFERALEFERRRVHALRDRGAARLLALRRLAELDVVAVRPLLQRDRLGVGALLLEEGAAEGAGAEDLAVERAVAVVAGQRAAYSGIRDSSSSR